MKPIQFSAVHARVSPYKQSPLGQAEQAVSFGTQQQLTRSVQPQALHLMGNIKFGGRKKYAGHTAALTLPELDRLLDLSKEMEINPVEPYRALEPGDQEALKHLVQAADVLDDVFYQQSHERSLAIKADLQAKAADGSEHAQKMLTVLEMFHNIEGSDGLSTESVKLFRGLELTLGKNNYPADLGVDEFVNYLKRYPEDLPELLTSNTVVRREGDRLVGIPYNEAFRTEFRQVARHLMDASTHTTHTKFAEYLQQLAQAIRSYDAEFIVNADRIFSRELEDSPLEFTITLEDYDDKLGGQVGKHPDVEVLKAEYGLTHKTKDMIGVRVGIVDLESKSQFDEFKRVLGKFEEAHVPGYAEYSQHGTSDAGQTLADVHLVKLGGDCLSMVPLAQNLPNDNKIGPQLGYGKRNVFHRQMRESLPNEEYHAEFLSKLIDPSQHALVPRNYRAFGDHFMVVGHELGHGTGPQKSRKGGSVKDDIGVYGDIIEEAKADLVSVCLTNYLHKTEEYYDDDQVSQIYMAKALRTLSIKEPHPPGHKLASAHAVRNLLQFNYFRHYGAMSIERGGQLKIDPEMFPQVAKQMLEEVIEIQLAGDVGRAQTFVDQWREWGDVSDYVAETRKSLKPKTLRQFKHTLAANIVSGAVI